MSDRALRDRVAELEAQAKVDKVAMRVVTERVTALEEDNTKLREACLQVSASAEVVLVDDDGCNGLWTIQTDHLDRAILGCRSALESIKPVANEEG